MLFNLRYLILGLSISTLSNGLPLDGAVKPRGVVQRTKSYAVVNVGGEATEAPVPTSSVIEEKTSTSTVQSTSSSSSVVTPPKKQPSPNPLPTPTPTPEPKIITVIVTETAQPTKFYDDGMWHTRYPVKTFEEVAVATAVSSTSSSTSYPPTVPTPVGQWHNDTEY